MMTKQDSKTLREFSLKKIAIRKADPRELYQDVIVVDGKTS